MYVYMYMFNGLGRVYVYLQPTLFVYITCANPTYTRDTHDVYVYSTYKWNTPYIRIQYVRI